MISTRSEKWREGWGIQRRVIGALVYRELKTRVSEVRFGVAGVFIEPVGVIIVFVGLHHLISHKTPGIDASLFFTPGAVYFSMFTEIAIRTLNAMKANESLFFYRPVKPVDTVIARALVEMGLMAIVYLVVLGGIFLLSEQVMMNDFPLLVISFLALAATAAGLGLIFLVAGHRYPILHQLLPISIRPLFLISGIFFSTYYLPQWLQPWMTWNPILQAVELSRQALSYDYQVPESISLPYLLALAAVSCCLGLWIYRNNERLLLTR